MKVACSYCQAMLRDKEPLDDPTTTHAICGACFEHYAPQWDGQSLGEFLDRFDSPVVAVDEDSRVLAINQSAAEHYGIEQRDAAGLLGGEAFECAHARLPGGCGQTIHCKGCAIRNTVAETQRSGRTMQRVPASLTTQDRTAQLLVSTFARDGVVFLHIEPALPSTAEVSTA